jgi:drug/metabolite transporter (DMT)-like permease
MVVLTIASALINGMVPNTMQFVGLLLGISGALILVIPDQLKSIFCRKTVVD